MMNEPRDIPPLAPASELGKRKRRMTARWQFTNRLNARASTGPKTADGKARVGRNAFRHGLSLPALSDPGFAPEVVELAHRMAQSLGGQAPDQAPDQAPGGERRQHAYHEHFCRIAETTIDLRRVRVAKLPLLAVLEADLANCDKPLAQLMRLRRYEQRTAARRMRVMGELYEAVTGVPVGNALRPYALRPYKAMRSKVKSFNEAPRRSRRERHPQGG